MNTPEEGYTSFSQLNAALDAAENNYHLKQLKKENAMSEAIKNANEFKSIVKKKSEKKESIYNILEEKYYSEFQLQSPVSRSEMIKTVKEYGIEDEQKAKKIISNFITKTRWDIRDSKNGFTFEPNIVKIKKSGDIYYIQLIND